MAKATLRAGLTYSELGGRVTRSQAAQLPRFDGTASLVTVASSRRGFSAAAALLGRSVASSFRGMKPVFVALREVTADALEYLASLEVRLLRDPAQSVVTRTDDDVTVS